MPYVDEKGYRRYSNLVHRQVAYYEIYLKNRDKYPKPFSEYVVHHIDRDKLNNNVNNLQIVTHEKHELIHMAHMSERDADLEENYATTNALILKKEKRKKYLCEDCGRKINHRGCCLDCNKERKEYREKLEQGIQKEQISKKITLKQRSLRILGGMFALIAFLTLIANLFPISVLCSLISFLFFLIGFRDH